MQIPGSSGLGEAIARPQRLTEIQIPRGAFGGDVATAVQGIAIERLRIAREEAAQAKHERELADRAQAAHGVDFGKISLQEASEQLDEDVRLGRVDKTEALAVWETRSSELVRDHSASVPTGFGGQVQSALEVQRASLRRNVRNSVRVKDREDIRGSVLGIMEAAEREAVADPEAARVKIATTLSHLGAAAGYGEDDQVKMLASFSERAYLRHGDQLIRGARDDVKALDALQERIAGGAFKSLSPEGMGQLEQRIINRKAQLQHDAEVRQRRFEAAAERKMRDAEDGTKALQTIVDGGGIPDDAFLAQVQRSTSGTPYAAAVTTLLSQGAERAGFASLPPDRQQAAILAMRAKANAEGTNPNLEKRIAKMQDIASSSASKAEKEPLKWGVDTRLLPGGVQPLQFGNLDQLAASLAQRVDQAATVAGAVKRPVSPMLTSEAHQAAEMLAILPPTQQATAVRTLARAMPPEQQRALATQIGDKDKALSIAMFLASMPQTAGVDASALVLRGADAKRAGRVKDSESVTTMDTTRIAQEVALVPWPTPQARDAAAQAAELAYLGLRDQNKGGSASWRDAIKFTSGEFADWNSAKVPVPPGWTERRFRNAMRNTDAVSLAGQMRGAVFVNGQEVRPEALAKALGSATLIPVGPGQYALDVGGMVLTEQRRPFIYTLRD